MKKSSMKTTVREEYDEEGDEEVVEGEEMDEEVPAG